ncbi:MAG: SPFH/Band 7/PHB domain protein [Candidatus Methylomirabilis sp.]|nr:SPFH/Band 7/PHB domain protein [Deltaproteobacteria bacterium]
MGGFVVIVLIAVAAIVTIFLGVRVVPQGYEHVVQRLGKYHATLKPGLNFVVPYLDTVAYKVVTMDTPLEIGAQEAITKDNAVIVANAIAFIKVLDPVKAVYGISDFRFAIQNLIMTTLRAIIGEMNLDEALSSRDMIKARLKEIISSDVVDWGISVKSVEIQDIKPSESMQRAMEQQASAERLRRATILEAEGQKQAAILSAQGKLEAAKLEAEAQVTLADASAQAIRNIAGAVGDKELPAMFLLGDRYVNALQQLAGSANAKNILLPADLLAAVKGLVSKQ